MKELIAKLMNHGFTEHQAQEFLSECYTIFQSMLLKRFSEQFNISVVKDNEN